MDSDWGLIGVQLQGTYVERQMKRTNRNLLLFCIVLLLLLAGFAYMEREYLYNFFMGPFPMDANGIGAVTDPDGLQHNFISVNGEDSFDTGVQRVKQKLSQSGEVKSESVVGEYSILVLGKHLLIVERGLNDKGKHYEGKLEALPDDVRAQIVIPLLSNYPEAEQAIFPLLLNATGFRKDGYFGLAVAIPIVLFIVWLFTRAIKRQNQPLLHPILSTLSQYGPIPIARAKSIRKPAGKS